MVASMLNEMTGHVEATKSAQVPSLGICVNDVCDLACIYCPPHGENMSANEGLCELASVESLLDCSAEEGIYIVRLTGGEPLLTPERCRRLLERSAARGFAKVILNTNGLHLTENMDWLSTCRHQFECKISLDTLHPRTFSQITGKDMLPQVLAGIQAAKEGALDVTINAVLTTVCEDQIFDLIFYCEENDFNIKILDVFDFCGKIAGRWCRYYASVDTVCQACEERFESLDAERLPGGRGISMRSFRLRNGSKLLLVPHHGEYRGTRLFVEACRACAHYPCAVGRFQIALRADGVLSPCRLKFPSGTDISGEPVEKIRSAVKQLLSEFAGAFYE